MQDEGSARSAGGPEATAAERPYRVKQVAAMLDVHPSTIYRAIETGALRALRVGQGRGGLRIPHAAYLDFLAGAVVRPACGSGGSR